jgi:biopolymer transport protein ExbD
LENTVININLLERRVREYFAGKPKKTVFIAGDEGLSYGFFIDTLDILKKAGVETVGLITEPRELKTAPQKK